MSIAFDIETTGLSTSDQITVSGFHEGERALFMLNVDSVLTDDENEKISQQIRRELESHVEEVEVVVEIYEDQRSLLSRMGEYAEEYLDWETPDRMVAFNGETWKGGFDLPFVRTQCILEGVDPVFEDRGVEYLDLMDPLQKRLHLVKSDPTGLRYKGQIESFCEWLGLRTEGMKRDELDRLVEKYDPDDRQLEEWIDEWNQTHEESEEIDVPTSNVGDLDGIYDLLSRSRDDLSVDWDPYESSQEAVEDWNDERWDRVCLHNFSDIMRTRQIDTVMREYIPDRFLQTDRL